MEIHKNQATPKYLGYVYQVLIAIEQCFSAKKNQTIWLECYGDVYDGKIGTEVKHHINESYLYSNSSEFWNTLNNIVIHDVSDIEEFVLHTTSSIRDDSIFYNWNELTKSNKYKRLKNHTPSDGIASYYLTTITNYKRSDLLPILDKLTIKSSQLSVQEKWEELKNNRELSYIPDIHKEDALHWVYGYVNKQAIEDCRYWQIKINDFDSAKIHSLNKYTRDKIPFPSVNSEDITASAQSFNFVSEMRNLKFRKKPIEQAISDYLRSGKSRVHLLAYEPFTMAKTLDEYDTSVREKVASKKHYWEAKLTTSATEDDLLDASLELYNDGINKLPLIDIPDVSSTGQYYQNGRIHHNVNKNLFSWVFKKEDLE
ncbi:MAG: hypothetical protein ACI9YH_002310 [Colwellia sp.]|jgi:hypothetical protein